MLAGGLLVETVGDGSSGGFVADTEEVKTGDDTSTLSSLTLRVVEVGWDTEYSIENIYSM